MKPNLTALSLFDNHVILYAKGWYKQTEVVRDVATLLCNCGLGQYNIDQLIRDNIVQLRVANTMFALFERSNISWDEIRTLYSEVWRSGVFTMKDSLSRGDVIQSMLDVIRYRCAESYDVLPLPDDAFLPVNRKLPNG